MFTPSQEDAGHQTSTLEPSAGTWRQLPPEATGSNVATATPPAYEENLQSVLEDSERHLDALWNMLNNQMTRLSTGNAALTNEAEDKTEPETENAWKPTPSEVPPLVEAAEPELTLSTADEPAVAEMPEENEAETALQPTAEDEPEIGVVKLEEVEEKTPEVAAEAEDDFAPTAETPAEEEVISAAPDMAAEEESDVEEADAETPAPVVMEAQAEEPAATENVATDVAAMEPVATVEPEAEAAPAPIVAEAKTEEVRPAPSALPAIRVDSAFKDNWLTVTAREAEGTTVLPTVRMMMQSQQNQSLQMRSLALGEMGSSETPIVFMESTEEAGAEPAAMRVEIAYSSDAPDVVFEVSAQVTDEVQITMSDHCGDLCASWEVNKQKGKSARAKATISRATGDPAVVVELYRSRTDDDSAVWQSALSFSVAKR